MTATILFVFLFAVSGCTAISCRNGWVHHDTSCYLAVHLEESWVVAEEHCRILGGMLAEINNASENAFLQSMLQRQNLHKDYWIGGTDVEVEGEWKWVSSRQRFTFTYWSTGEPNNVVKDGMSEGCAMMSWGVQYKWNDANCATDKAHFVCEIDETIEVNVFG